MRPIALTFLVLLGGCSFGGSDGIAGQGSGTQRSWRADGFEKVELAGSDDVDVRVGQAFSVRADGPAEVLDRLRIETDGDTLEIGRKRGDTVAGKARITVTLPRITGASVAGSGNMRIDRAGGAGFEGSLAGSGNLQLGQLQADAATLNIAGSGTARLAGAAKSLEVSIAGSGDVDAPQLTANEAEISIAGSGNVRATVNGRAEVNIMGSGDVDLGTGAKCQVSKMGSGSVRCGG